MATYTKRKLSGTPNGNIPKYMMTYTSADIHRTGTSSTIQDEVWIWVSSPNAGANNVIQIDIDNGVDVTAIILEIQPNATILAIAGLPLSGDGTNTSCVAISNTGSYDISVYGFVNRITP